MTSSAEWKGRVQKMLQTCQGELKRTTEIGKRMLSASKTNSKLHENYEELGVLLVKAMESGEVKWDNARVQEIMSEIKICEKSLEEIEDEVNNIRFSDTNESSQSSTDSKSSN